MTMQQIVCNMTDERFYHLPEHSSNIPSILRLVVSVTQKRHDLPLLCLMV